MGKRNANSFSKDHPPPGPGRRKGQPKRATLEIRDCARSILEDPVVRTRTLALAREGRLAPGVLVELLHYAYGKPKDTTDVHVQVSRMIRIMAPQEEQCPILPT
jgi:hypothetical protein